MFHVAPRYQRLLRWLEFDRELDWQLLPYSAFFATVHTRALALGWHIVPVIHPGSW